MSILADRKALGVVAVVGLCAGLVALVWLVRSQPALEQSIVVRHVHWELTVRNNGNSALRDIEIFSFLPIGVTWSQSVVETHANYPLEAQGDGGARNQGRILLDSIPPYGQRHVRLGATIELTVDYPNELPEELDQWRQPEPLIESANPDILRLAERLQGETPAQSARRIYDWLVEHIEYSGYDPQDRGALYAISNRRGDCSEFAALAVALARAQGLPARLVNGYAIPNDGKLSPYQFHAWAEVHMNDRWLILDAQEQVFDPTPENFLAFYYGTAASSSRGWTRFHAPHAQVAIDMQ